MDEEAIRSHRLLQIMIKIMDISMANLSKNNDNILINHYILRDYIDRTFTNKDMVESA